MTMADGQERTVLPGTVDLLILRTLADGPQHGFGISRDLRRRSDGVVELQDAALYQALHRMRRQGLIAGEWGLSDNNRRARFYALTPAGQRRLAREERDFRRYALAVLEILRPRGPAADEGST
jgi:transcriptional regulator